MIFRVFRNISTKTASLPQMSSVRRKFYSVSIFILSSSLQFVIVKCSSEHSSVYFFWNSGKTKCLGWSVLYIKKKKKKRSNFAKKFTKICFIFKLCLSLVFGFNYTSLFYQRIWSIFHFKVVREYTLWFAVLFPFSV